MSVIVHFLLLCMLCFEILESATQFNREYSRFFGKLPMRDVRALLSPGAPNLELVGSP
jgi:hypothetical protein